MTDVLRLFGPLVVWLGSFSAVYGLQGLVCSDRWTMSGLTLSDGRLVLVAAWLTAIAVQVGLLLVLRRYRSASAPGFAAGISLWLSAAAIVATIWSLFPVAVTSTCG